MDEYTQRTQTWLDGRFCRADAMGCYESHAPIYGFRPDQYALGLYINNYHLLREIEALRRLHPIVTFLEVGCAEGFTAHLVRSIFGFKTTVCDLSGEAVKRAKEIYGLEGFSADVQSLSHLPDNSFDLVLCSETIEHVPRPDKAFQELARVSKQALIVTVPAANSPAEKSRYVPPPGPHTHLHIFTKSELQSVWKGARVRPVSLLVTDKLSTLLAQSPPLNLKSRSKILAATYYLIRTLTWPLRHLYGATMAKWIIKADYWLSFIFPNARTVTYLLRYDKTPAAPVSAGGLGANLADFLLAGSAVAPHKL